MTQQIFNIRNEYFQPNFLVVRSKTITVDNKTVVDNGPQDNGEELKALQGMLDTILRKHKATHPDPPPEG